MSENQIDWAAANFRYQLRPQPKIEPEIDEVISGIVGQKIYQSDPRLIRLIVKWRKDKPFDSLEPDNFLQDEHKIKELKEVLTKPFI